MRVLFLILMLIVGMNTYAQTPPTPPAPPEAGTTPSGITYAKSETSTSLAVSFQFNGSYNTSILSIINTNISDFDGSLKVVDNSNFYEKVELKPTSLKLEIKTNGNAVSQNFINEKDSLLTIYNAILAL